MNKFFSTGMNSNKRFNNTTKTLSMLPWATLSSLGSEINIPKPNYVNIKDIVESSEGDIAQLIIEANAKNRYLNKEYRKAKSIVNSSTKEEVKALLIPFKEEWVLPHVLAFFGTKQCYPIVSEGVVNVLATLVKLGECATEGILVFDDGKPVSKNALKGMVNFLKISPRGDVMPKGITQGSPAGLRYNSSIPLLLSSWKQYHNILYMQYDYEDDAMEYILDEDLLDLMKCVGTQLPWDEDTLVAMRDQALYIKSTGGMRTVDKCTMIYNTGNADFDSLPKLVKLLILQTWVFQPKHYRDYSVHNLMDLDKPASYQLPVATELFKDDTKEYNTKECGSIPW